MSESAGGTAEEAPEGGEGGGSARAFERGNELAQSGHLKDAEKAYRQADEAGHPTAAAYVGLYAEMRGDGAGARAAYERADERGDGYGAFRLGMLLAGRDEWEQANAAWARADERGRKPAGPDLAALMRRQGRPAERRPLTPGPSALTNPVLVGALALLALVVAVFLAYTANAGLPFVPTKELKVDIADGSNLVVGNDVREGGYRIGLVSDLKPIELSNGQVGAELTIHLDESKGTVPVDTRVSIQPRSVLGLKYVELTKGTSARDVPDGGTLPISQTTVPVQFDDVFKTFDPKTRESIQKGLVGFGDALAARGSALNDTISSLPELLKHLNVVAGYLSAPSTQLTRFIRSLNGFMGAVSPVSGALADSFGQMATTFAAISRDPSALEQTIAESPSTLDASTSSLAVQRPFLADLAELGTNMTPATAELRRALPQLNPAIEAGTRVLVRTPSLNAKLQQVMNALKSLATFPGTNVALNGLTSTVSTLNPMIRYLGPYVTVCNDWNYWWTFLSEHISEETSVGFAQRALLNQTNGLQQNNVGQQGATAPVNGGGSDLSPFGGNEFLHSQNYGAAVDNSGNADCEIGQRGYPRQLNGLDPQHRLLATDAHTPGDQGPTYRGRPRVPAGETYSRNPSTGPQLPSVPSNP